MLYIALVKQPQVDFSFPRVNTEKKRASDKGETWKSPGILNILRLPKTKDILETNTKCHSSLYLTALSTGKFSITTDDMHDKRKIGNNLS